MGSHSNRMRHDARSYSASQLTSSSAHNTSRTSHTTGCKDLNTLELGLSARRELLSVNELPKLLDEAISEEEQLDMDLASAVCQRFLEWDLETQEASLGQVRARLAQVLGRDVDRDVDRTDEE